MRVMVVRDEGKAPGAVEWVDHGGGEMVFVVSTEGMTDVGARALEAAWAAFVDAGVWRWQEAGGTPITATYHRTGEPGTVVEVTMSAGIVDVWLSTRHYCWATVNSLQASVRDCLHTGGWSHHPLRHAAAA